MPKIAKALRRERKHHAQKTTRTESRAFVLLLDRLAAERDRKRASERKRLRAE